jgi:hypothetical protein
MLKFFCIDSRFFSQLSPMSLQSLRSFGIFRGTRFNGETRPFRPLFRRIQTEHTRILLKTRLTWLIHSKVT